MSDIEPETFTWTTPELGGTTTHAVGDPKCTACCNCDGPKRCEECGGILHAALDDEVQSGDGWEWAHSRRCDRPCPCIYCPELEVGE